MMMTANLVGFVIGVDGMRYMVEQFFGTIEGNVLYASSLAQLFIASRCFSAQDSDF